MESLNKRECNILWKKKRKKEGWKMRGEGGACWHLLYWISKRHHVKSSFWLFSLPLLLYCLYFMLYFHRYVHEKTNWYKTNWHGCLLLKWEQMTWKRKRYTRTRKRLLSYHISLPRMKGKSFALHMYIAKMMSQNKKVKVCAFKKAVE